MTSSPDKPTMRDIHGHTAWFTAQSSSLTGWLQLPNGHGITKQRIITIIVSGWNYDVFTFIIANVTVQPTGFIQGYKKIFNIFKDFFTYYNLSFRD